MKEQSWLVKTNIKLLGYWLSSIILRCGYFILKDWHPPDSCWCCCKEDQWSHVEEARAAKTLIAVKVNQIKRLLQQVTSCKGRVRLSNRMNFRKPSKGVGGHVQSKKLCCRFCTFIWGFFWMFSKKIAIWFSKNEGGGSKAVWIFFQKFICFGSLTRPLGALTSLNFKLSASNANNVWKYCM